MGGTYPFVEPIHLFHAWCDNHSVELFEILLLFADFHNFACRNVHRPEQLVSAKMGHQRWCFGQFGVVFSLFLFVIDFHQVENWSESAFHEDVSRGACGVGLV